MDVGERSVFADIEPVIAKGSGEPAGLERDVQTARPNQNCLANSTYIGTAEGWHYLAVALDLSSRPAVGWSIKADQNTSRVMDALMMTVCRDGKADALQHHWECHTIDASSRVV